MTRDKKPKPSYRTFLWLWPLQFWLRRLRRAKGFRLEFSSSRCSLFYLDVQLVSVTTRLELMLDCGTTSCTGCSACTSCGCTQSSGSSGQVTEVQVQGPSSPFQWLQHTSKRHDLPKFNAKTESDTTHVLSVSKLHEYNKNEISYKCTEVRQGPAPSLPPLLYRQLPVSRSKIYISL